MLATATRNSAASLAFLLLTIVAIACGMDSSAQEPGRLTIYAAREEELVGPIVDRFSKETGIQVDIKYGGTTQIVATILEEGKNSPADLFWTRDPGGLGVLSPKLAPLSQAILDLAPPWAKSTNNNWVGISARVRVVVYNSERVTLADLPPSIEGLTLPHWKDRVGWSPTSGPTQTMITYMRLAWGKEKTLQWIQAMERNQAVKFGSHTAVVAAVRNGEVDLGLVNHYYAHRFRQEHGESVPVQNYYFSDGGPGNLAMISGAGVLRTAKNRQNAESFLQFMLSADSQQYFTAKTFEYPVVEGISINQALTPLSEINRPEADMNALGDLQETLAMLRDLGIIP